MVGICAECKTKIGRNAPGVVCSGVCGIGFHLRCNTALSQAEKDLLGTNTLLSWICSTCKNSHGPGASGHPSALPGMEQVVSLLNELKKSVEFCSGKIDDFERLLQGYAAKMAKLDDVYTECETLKRRVEDLEQRSRSNNIELVGIPEKSGENLLSVVSLLGARIGVDVDVSDVDAVHRVAPVNHASGRPKNIIVRMISRIKRDNFVGAARKVKELNSGGLGFSEKLSIYVNDHLTPERKMLLNKAKSEAKKLNYKYVWVKNSRIYVRKSDGTPVVMIGDVSDIAKIK